MIAIAPRVTDVTFVEVRTGARERAANCEMNSIDLARRHVAVGFGAIVVGPGRRLCQLGVRIRSESQRSRRQEFATSPRSNTT